MVPGLEAEAAQGLGRLLDLVLVGEQVEVGVGSQLFADQGVDPHPGPPRSR